MLQSKQRSQAQAKYHNPLRFEYDITTAHLQRGLNQHSDWCSPVADPIDIVETVGHVASFSTLMVGWWTRSPIGKSRTSPAATNEIKK